MKNNQQPQLMIYQSKSGQIEFRGDFERETIWGNINQIADVFGVQKATISKHLKNIYKEKELDRQATVSILETVQVEGKRQVERKIEYYNLDAIISVGYRVNSRQATQFRIWATSLLKKHLINGNKRSGAFAFVWLSVRDKFRTFDWNKVRKEAKRLEILISSFQLNYQ